MRSIVKFSVISILAAMVMVGGCDKDDGMTNNKITIAGNENIYHEYNDDYSFAEGFYYKRELKCEEAIYGLRIQIYFSPSAVFVADLRLQEDFGEIFQHSFSISGSCTEGCSAGFELQGEMKAPDLLMSSGTVEVTRLGNIYDIDVYLTIASDDGGGTLKGSFHGELANKEPASPPPAPVK